MKIARLTDAEVGDKESSLCMEVGNEMEGVEEGEDSLLALNNTFCKAASSAC